MSFFDLSQLQPDQAGGLSFACSCQKKHAVATKKVIFGQPPAEVLPDLTLELLPAGNLLFVSDKALYDRFARPLQRALSRTHLITPHLLDQPPYDLKEAGKMLKMGEDIRLVVSYGSGSLTDLCKYYAALAGIPHLAVGSAPSTDSYLSPKALLRADGCLREFSAKPPEIFVYDNEAAAKAPRKIFAAGFGEMMGKLVALFDWNLAFSLRNEPYCENAANLIQTAIADCFACGDGLIKGNREAADKLGAALIKCGLCAQLLGSERAISGGARQMGRALQILLEEAGTPLLSGECVMLASLYLGRLYPAFLEQEINEILPPPDFGLRAAVLEKFFHLRQKTYLAEHCKLSDQTLTEYKMKEYRRDFYTYAQEVHQKLLDGGVLFRRIYPDAGLWMEGFLSAEQKKLAFALAPDLDGTFTLLTYLRDRGLTDELLPQPAPPAGQTA